MIRRIIIFRPGAIGDSLLTFPAFQALRDCYPAAEITVVGNRPALELAVEAGLIHRCDAFGADWVADLYGDETTPALRERLAEYDLGIIWLHAADAAADLAASLRAAGVARVLPLVSFPPDGSRQHLAQFLGETLTPLGVTVPGPRFVLPLPPVPRTRPIHNLGAIDRISSGKTVVLHPGAGARRKRWSAERFAALAERFGARGDAVFLTSGPADEAAVAAVQENARGVNIEVLRDYRLIDLATVLRRANLFIGNDSGVTHLASILGVPTVALFGPFDPAYWMPIGPYVKVIDAGLGCPHRDDPREGCRQCDVLGAISVDMVWDAAPSVCQKMVLF